jgi:hypothetical protein
MPILPEVRAGNWYFVVTCPDCHRQQPIGPAPSPEQMRIVHPWPIDPVVCDCGAITPYRQDQIQRLQALYSERAVPNGVFRFRREN